MHGLPVTLITRPFAGYHHLDSNRKYVRAIVNTIDNGAHKGRSAFCTRDRWDGELGRHPVDGRRLGN